MMKRNDDFLRVYRKEPRRAFSESLYKKLSGRKSFVDWMKRGAVWGAMVATVVYGLSLNLMGISGSGWSSPAADSANGMAAHQEHPALLGERGLKPREFVATPSDEDWLGPFDRPEHTQQQVAAVESVEFAVVIVPAVYR
jgi:hypothetical protein